MVGAVQKYHGGLISFRKKLGQESERKPNGYWESLENAIVEAKKAMEENGWGELPNDNMLRKSGHSSLGFAISKHHGGFLSFRELLSQEMNITSEREQLEALLESYVGKN